MEEYDAMCCGSKEEEGGKSSGSYHYFRISKFTQEKYMMGYSRRENGVGAAAGGQFRDLYRSPGPLGVDSI